MSPPDEWLKRQRKSITRRLINSLVRSYRALPSYHQPDAARFSREVTPVVKGAQHSLADAVAAAFAEKSRREFNREVPPPVIRNNQIVDLRGVQTQEVYQRPFHDIWQDLKAQDAAADEAEQKGNLKKAIDKGENRLKAIADEDLQLTYAHATREAMNGMRGQNKPTWWKRVPQGSYTCAMCLIISTRTYRTGELNPLHPNCDCTVEPQYTPYPGMVHDEELLEKVHARVEKELGFRDWSGKDWRMDYRDILIEIIEDHGELGHVLVHPRKRK